MSDTTDERLDLPVAQSVMLWTLRIWVTGLHHEINASARIQRMMERMDAPEAAPFLDGFMFALSHGAKRKIAIHCACHSRIGADERLLLDVLRLAQESRLFEALLLLRGMVTDEAARAALRSAQGLGAELAGAGRFLSSDDGLDGLPDGTRQAATLH